MEEFKVWLCEQKKYTERSARDVCSRLKRVCLLLNKKNIEDCKVDDLEINEEFKTLSMSVRSQLRKSVKLFFEYTNNN